MCQFVRDSTPPEATIVFQKPRLAGLLTGRHFVAYHQPRDRDELWDYFRSVHVSYILLSNEFASDQQYLHPMLVS